MSPGSQLGPERAECLLASRQIAEELISLADETARDERRLDRRGTRQHRHRHARLERGRDQPRARIVHSRQARIRDERDPLAGLEPRQQLRRALSLVVLVVAEEPGLDPVPVEQAFRMPRVLAQNDVGLPQLVQHAKRHVLEIADRGRADREGH